MTSSESPAQYIEDTVDAALFNSKLEEKLILEGSDSIEIKKAIIKGCNADRDVLRSLVRIKNLSYDEQNADAELNQNYLVTVAEEFGYRK